MRRLLFLIALLLSFSVASRAQGVLIPNIAEQFLNVAAQPAVLYKLCTYQAGTTTPLATYSDVGLTIQNTNPTIITTGGYPFNVVIYVNPATNYKYTLRTAGTDSTCSTGVVLYTRDNVTAAGTMTGSVLDCSGLVAASYSARLAACVAALPSAGGTADMRKSSGVQTWNSDALSGVTKPVDVLCGAATITVSVTSTVVASAHLIAGEGCNLFVNSGITLTVLGPMDGSSLSQHFSGNGTVTLSASASSNIYSADCTWFGVVMGSSAITTDTSAQLQTCLNSFGPSTGGAASLPPGYTVANNITIPIAVNFHGAQGFSTVFKGTTATPMLTFATNATAFAVDWTDFTIWGNSVATKCLVLPATNNTFTLQRFIVENCTQKGIENNGSLVFMARDFFVFASVIGYDQIGLHSNLTQFDNFQFKNNTSWGAHLTAGNVAVFHNPDFEQNGTVGNAATGGILATGMNGDGEGICLELEGGSWGESNKGFAEIQLGQPSNGSYCNNIINGLTVSGASSTYGIYASGNKTMYTLNSVSAQNHTGAGQFDIYDDATVLGCTITNSHYSKKAVNCNEGSNAIPGSAYDPSLFYAGGFTAVINANSGGVTAIVAAGSGGTGVGHSLEILAAGNTPSQPAAFFGNNGGSGELLVNTASSDFSSCIFCTLGTIASVSVATNAKVLAFNSSGGDGKSQIVVTKSGGGTTQPLEIFSDSTLLATFLPVAGEAFKVAGTGQTLGTTAGTFAQLPGSPTVGDCKWVTDSMSATFMAIIAGAGGNQVNACWNGTNWIVH